MAEDYYQTLGVSRQASDQEIRRAYRKLAMKHHPDRNEQDKDAEQKFKAAKQAYEVLSDPQKRAAYDQFGHDGFTSAGMGGGFNPGAAPGVQDFFSNAFEDIFGEDLFGGHARRSGRRTVRGRDIEYPVDLTLEEAAFGVEKNIRIASMQMCKRCNGNGAEPGSGKRTCGSCGGAGQVRMQQGFFSIQQTCPQCRGTGEVIERPCAKCGGGGRVRETRSLSVKIPAGVDERKHIRLSGEGEGGANGGSPGDLYIRVRIKPHEVFKREGHHLLVEVPILFTTAALGGEVEIPSLGGRLKLKIPAETQSGRQFRMRGKGMASLDGHPGDLICKVSVETPVHLTAKQKDLLREFDASLSGGKRRHTPQADNWIDGIRKFFDNLNLKL